VHAILEQMPQCQSVRKTDLRRGDRLRVETENSVYDIAVLEDATYRISGGWFDRQGMSPVRISISGCTWGGTVIKNDIVAACGLHMEFGNRVVTSRIREVRVIRDEKPDEPDLPPARSHDLTVACYGPSWETTSTA
jgi:hypothetical protein